MGERQNLDCWTHHVLLHFITEPTVALDAQCIHVKIDWRSWFSRKVKLYVNSVKVIILYTDSCATNNVFTFILNKLLAQWTNTEPLQLGNSNCTPTFDCLLSFIHKLEKKVHRSLMMTDTTSSIKFTTCGIFPMFVNECNRRQTLWSIKTPYISLWQYYVLFPILVICIRLKKLFGVRNLKLGKFFETNSI